MCDAIAASFTGYFRDAETGNDYAVNRYMTPSSGRFMTPDPSGKRFVKPANSQSWNMYAYAKGDPINHRDARGLDDDDDDDDGACLKTSTCGECFDPTGLIDQPGPDCSGGDDDDDDDDDDDSGPTCTIEMYTRFLNFPKGFAGPFATHSYLVVTEANGSATTFETFDGQRNGNLLTGEYVVGGYGKGNNPGSATNIPDGLPIAIPCSDISLLEQDTKNFAPVVYHAFGPNSNSYLHWLLNQIGLGGVLSPLGLGHWGWNTPIPGASGGS